MIETGNDIERLLSAIIRKEGFRKKGKTWLRDAPETIAVVELQRSQFANRYFLNVGVFVKSLPDLIPEHPQDLVAPKSYRCHLQLRLPDLMADKARAEALFDLNHANMDSAEREQAITSAIRDLVLPFFDKTKTLGDITAAIRAEPRLGHATMGPLRKIVGQPAPSTRA